MLCFSFLRQQTISNLAISMDVSITYDDVIEHVLIKDAQEYHNGQPVRFE